MPLSHAVVDELRSAIIGGDYAQGERLVEEEVAARFDVSRNPIREALRTLSTEGFVVIEPRRGARVASIDAAAAGELFELRAPLEGLVAGLAAQRRTAAHLATLDDRRRCRADGRRRATAARVAGAEHASSTTPSPWPPATSCCAARSVGSPTSSGGSTPTRISRRSTKSWDEHAAIVDAVAAGDVERARRCGEEHIAAAAAAYQSL